MTLEDTDRGVLSPLQRTVRNVTTASIGVFDRDARHVQPTHRHRPNDFQSSDRVDEHVGEPCV